MKHAGHVKRALFVAAALAIGGRAHALGGSSGQGTAGTGGPQVVYDRHVARPESPGSTERGADGVPTWYAVDAAPRAPRARGPVMLVERSGAVPGWYAID